MSKFNNGMRAYSEAFTVMTAAGLACGSLVLSAVFAKSALVEGNAKDAGISLGGAAFAAGSGLSAVRSAKKLARMMRGDEQAAGTPPSDDSSPPSL